MGKEKRPERRPRNKLSAHVTRDMKRKQLKPITEKIRRERINNSLRELKVLVLSAMNKDVLQYAKMEKADILDMAVKYIKCIQAAKQESKDSSDGPTQRNHQALVVTSPGKVLINTNHITHRQSSTPDIDCESSWSGMIGLVQPEVPKPHQAYATMATPKDHSSSSVLAEYALIPSSLNNDPFQPNTANARESDSPTCNKTGSPRFSRQSMETFSATSKLRSPLAEKSDNVFSTESTVNNKLLLTNFGKRQNTSTENQDSVRLPGMECFVKDTHMAAHSKENRITSNHALLNQRRELQIDQFENVQYSLPLWRPW